MTSNEDYQKWQYTSKEFWVGAADRAIAALGQTALVFFTAGISGILEVEWLQLASVLGLAVAASLATSLAYPKRVISGEENTQHTAQVVEERIREALENGVLTSRDTERTTSISPYQKADGSYITRKELRLNRQQEED